MNYPNLSVYSRIHEIESTEVMPIDVFLENIRTGEWQDIVIPIRATKDKKERDELKKKIAPSVTLSGTFSPRTDKDIITHSGFIGVDIDDLGANTEAFKALVAQDKYTYAVFTSISGYGVCVVVRIDPDHHREAYLGLAKYYLDRFKQPVDPTGLNVSRPRFISFDPHMVLNETAEIFKKYLPKEKKTKPPPVVFVQNEFDDVIRQIIERSVNCVEDYRDWLKVCFALCNRFGEGGRHYFHSLSAISAKYDPAVADKQYTLALSHESLWAGKKATLSTIYYHAKLAGINIESNKTKKITAATSSMKKSGLSKESIILNLEKFEGVPRAECEHIVTEAFDSGQEFHDSDTLIDNVIMWVRSNYALRRNAITLRIENSGKSMTDEDLNTMFLMCKKVFNDLTFDLFTRCIFSNFTPTYNPFHEWWQFNEDTPYDLQVVKFWKCITLTEGQDWDKMVYFGNKWLVSLVGCVYFQPSPLVLTFTGPIGIGKTQIFRRLLPRSWRTPVDYYAESPLNGGKDDDILMCQKILIVDDEFGGQGKREQRQFKAKTDKQTFDIRAPYGRNSATMLRLCMLGASANDEGDILPDPHGNRRVLPFSVANVDWAAINEIDRDALWAELFRMYHSGFDTTVVKGDIDILAAGNDRFVDYSLEYDLINAYYSLPDIPDEFGVHEYTAGEIKEHIDRMSGQRINLNKLGQELKRLGFVQVIKKINKRTCRVYQVKEKRVGPGLDLSGGFKPFDTGSPI